MQYFAQDEATRLDPTLTVYETLGAGSPDAHGAGHPQHPRRLPVLRRRRLQEGGRAVGRRAHAPRGRAHAAAPVEHAAARRADQPPRPRLEGRAARRARGLRRHADLRLARPLLRREARDEDRRGRAAARRTAIPGATRNSCGASSSSGERRPNRRAAAGGASADRRRTGAAARGEEPQPAAAATAGGTAVQAPANAARDSPSEREAKRTGADPKRARRDRARRRSRRRSRSSRTASPACEAAIKDLEQAMASPGLLRRPRARRSRSSIATRR